MGAAVSAGVDHPLEREKVPLQLGSGLAQAVHDGAHMRTEVVLVVVTVEELVVALPPHVVIGGPQVVLQAEFSCRFEPAPTVVVTVAVQMILQSLTVRAEQEAVEKTVVRKPLMLQPVIVDVRVVQLRVVAAGCVATGVSRHDAYV